MINYNDKYEEKYKEEINLLFKALRTDGFRFIIVKYNHYSLVKKLKDDLKDRFPTRSSFTIDAEKTDYRTFVESYYNLKEGFFFVENFDKILENPELYAGINQRRDKLANYPIALIAFISPSAPVLYARQIMEKMPDLWSFRSLMMELEKVILEKPSFRNLIENNIKISSLGGVTREEKITELERLENVLKTITNQNDTSLLESVLEQKTTLQTDLGNYNEAIETLDLLISIVLDEKTKTRLLIDRGDNYMQIGNSKSSLNDYEKSLKLSIKQKTRSRTALIIQRIGVLYAWLGNLDKALSYFKQLHILLKEIFEENPSNLSNKIKFITTYQLLGEAYKQRKEIDKAIKFFNLFHDNIYIIHLENPNNENIEYILSDCYKSMGVLYYEQENLEQALFCFQENIKINENIFKNSDKNYFNLQLSSSYLEIAKVYHSLGDLDNAILFFNKGIESLEYVYKSNKNMNIKNSLAIAYANLGLFYAEKNRNNKKSYNYLVSARKLWKELTKEAPMNKEFEHSVNKVNQEIQNLKNQTT